MHAKKSPLLIFDASRNAFTAFKTPFTMERLRSHGIELTDDPHQARVLIAERRPQLFRALARAGFTKRCFLFTDEPSYDFTTRPDSWLVPGLKRLQVMNVFTGEVFTDAAGFIGTFGLNQPLDPYDEADIRRRFDRKRGAAFITNRPARETRRVVQGRDVDLNARRIAFALAGFQHGVVDIYGAGFPDGVAVAATGWGTTRPGEEWWDVKHRTLARDYSFNLCFENTDWPNYITEKLWQSVRAGCLPVYSGRNNRIREVLPENSYVEAADFTHPAALYEYLHTMSFTEHFSRLQKCRDAYLALQNRWHAGQTDTLLKRMDRLAVRLHATA